MASVRFTRIGTTPEGLPRYQATFSRLGEGVPRGRQMSAQEMLRPHPSTDKRFVPRGVDRDAPRGRAQ